jgi:hypothetical protein
VLAASGVLKMLLTDAAAGLAVETPIGVPKVSVASCALFTRDRWVLARMTAPWCAASSARGLALCTLPNSTLEAHSSHCP